jgi:hypothetical protein
VSSRARRPSTNATVVGLTIVSTGIACYDLVLLALGLG